MDYVVGIDVGTSAVKGLLVTREGGVAARAGREFEMSAPRPGWAEQDPEEWWAASAQVFKELSAKAGGGGNIKAVGLTGQMHSSVFLDKDFKIIRPALLWCDQRTEAECEEITSKVGFEKLVSLTANRALTGFTAPKVLWLRNREPGNFRRLKHLLLAKDYVRFRLTGRKATDVSDASGTLFFDVAKRRWSEEMMELLDLPRELLPECFESPEITGEVTAKAGEETGLAPGTPVVAGGGDQAAGAVGNGVVDEGPVLITVGTSGVVFAAARKPVLDPEARVHSFCHAAPGRWHTMGVMLSAGGSLRWLRETLREAVPELDYEQLGRLAGEAPPGCHGLLFLPYLTGERTPHFDPRARGVFFGLSLKSDLASLARAVMEGVAFALLDSVRLMKEAGARMEEVYLSGGGARSELWGKIIASALNLPVRRLSVDEGPAFGAAVLARAGIGWFSSVEEAAAASLSLKDEIEPVPEWGKVYEEASVRFRSLYSSVREEFKKISEE